MSQSINCDNLEDLKKELNKLKLEYNNLLNNDTNCLELTSELEKLQYLKKTHIQLESKYRNLQNNCPNLELKLELKQLDDLKSLYNPLLSKYYELRKNCHHNI